MIGSRDLKENNTGNTFSGYTADCITWEDPVGIHDCFFYRKSMLALQTS